MDRKLTTRPSRWLARPWLVAFIPINAATSAFGVVLPLLILIPLHGAWTDVALAATLFNGAVILASMVWGWIADHYPTRRKLLLLNYAAFGLLYFAIASVQSIAVLFVVYTIVGFIAPAGASASNLLILEKFGAAERPSAFASFQLMSMLGSIAGLLGGYFWLTAGLSLLPLLYVLALLAMASVGAVAWGVRDAPSPLSTAHVASHPESLASRIRHLDALKGGFPFFPKRPRLSALGLARFRRWIREEARHELPLIFAATFLFNLTSNLFNISYTPYLYAAGLGAASIFLVNLSNNATQALVFPSSGAITSRRGADPLVRSSTYVRALGYLAVAGFTFVPLVVASAFLVNLVAFGVLGGAIAFYSTASSIILFRALEGRDAGTLLGVNSALGGIAAIAGAGLSGVLSVFGSYRLTFLVSAAGLLVSLPLWAAAALASARRRPAVSPPAAPTDPPAERPAPGLAEPGQTD
ncbi:MAG TPA: MFS transporter [Thermoplasmata archaeon]|nr:MFS transporter [Thermoplasmata archaeon]